MVDSITPSLDQIKAACGRVLTPRTEIGPGMGALTAATLDTVFGRLRATFEPLLQAFQRASKPPGSCGSSMPSHFMGPPQAEWDGESSRLPYALSCCLPPEVSAEASVR